MTRPRLRDRRTRRLRVTAAGAVACLAVGTALAPGALATDRFTDGQWYATDFKLQQNHTIATGSGVTVAVIDGRIAPSAPALVGVRLTPQPAGLCRATDGKDSQTSTDADGNHASEMVAMIAGQGGANVPQGVAPGAAVLSYTIGYPAASQGGGDLNCDTTTGDNNTYDAIKDAVDKGARIVNMSFGVRASLPATQRGILYGEQRGVVFVYATDDHETASDTRITPPGTFNGVVVVNGITRDSELIPMSATGTDAELVAVTAPGRDLSLGGYTAPGVWDPTYYVGGSSPGAAFVSGALAVVASKYPKATGNQLIQALVRTTGGKQHDIYERTTDGFGFGTVSLTGMLALDPTTLPDENPLLRDGAEPSTAEITGGSAGSSSPAPSGSDSGGGGSSAGTTPASTPPVAADRSTDGSGAGLWIGIGIGVVVLVLIVVLVAVLVSRRGRRSGPPPPSGGPPGPPVGSYSTR